MEEAKTLIEQIAEWHGNDGHHLIVHAILTLSETERTSELIGLMARAYNNMNQYAKAEELLMSIPEVDRGSAWHYRLSYAYFYSKRVEEARVEIQRALEIEPDDQFSLDFAAYIERFAPQKQDKQAFADTEDVDAMNTIRASRPKRRM